MRCITSVIKVGVVYVGVHVSRHLKEELAWARGKWLQVISNIKKVILKNEATLSLNNIVCIAIHVVLNNIF